MGKGGFVMRVDAGATWWGHRVEAAGMQRVAFDDSFKSEPTASQRTVATEGFGRIVRASGMEPTTAGRAKDGGENRRDQPLVEPDESEQNPSGEADDFGQELRHEWRWEVSSRGRRSVPQRQKKSCGLNHDARREEDQSPEVKVPDGGERFPEGGVWRGCGE